MEFCEFSFVKVRWKVCVRGHVVKFVLRRNQPLLQPTIRTAVRCETQLVIDESTSLGLSR